MKLFLVDGSALLYRSHFAFRARPLTTSHGEVTSAAFGFANALVRLLEDEGGEGLVVAFDAKGKTQRHEKYPEYKAQRPPMPPELAAQVDRVKEVVRAIGAPLVELEGVEADDSLATLARQAADAGHEVWIYSGDKDFLPLLRPGIGLLKPAGRSGSDRYLDHEAFRQEHGLRPAQFRDVLALMGDKSDNVPGVPGIGEKTAVKLVQEFGSIDALLGELDDDRLTKRQRENLQENREQLLLSRELVTVDEHVGVELDEAAAAAADPRRDAFRELCAELEFQGLLERIGRPPGDAPGGPSLRYHQVAGLEALDALLDRIGRADRWCVDTETTSLDAHRAELVGISLAVEAGEAWYIPVDAGGGGGGNGDLFSGGGEPRLPWAEVRERLAGPLADPSIAKVGQNLKYDQIVLAAHDAPLGGVDFDTMIASYLLAPERRAHNMDALASEVLGLSTTSYKELFEGTGTKDIRQLPLDRLTRYACEDADITLRLHDAFAPQLAAEGLDHLMAELEIPLSQVLLRMEQRGIRLDTGLLEELSREWTAEMEQLVEGVHELAGGEFNLNSPRQLQEVLFERLGLKPVKKTATGYSTDVEVLSKLADEHELPGQLLEYRQLQKLLGTYVDALPRMVNPRTGCLHTSFNQAVAATGRLSSTDPNLQNIPIRTDRGRRIREAFVPRGEGQLLLSADYSQVELRLAAHFSGDEHLRQAFRDGEDIHAATAAIVNGVSLAEVDGEMRRAAKAINFGILYGMGARALAQNLGVKVKEAQGFIDQYFERLPDVRRWIDETVERAREEGEVRTLLGRRRRLPELASRDPRQKSFGERIAVNTPVQGSAADLIKQAMIALDARLEREGLPARLLLQVHDELVLEVDEGAVDEVAAAVREEMEGVAELSVPLSVELDSGPNWARAH